MKDTKITNGNPLPDEVEVNLNVLGPLMLHRVAGHVDSTDVSQYTIVARRRGVCSSSSNWRS